MSLIWKWIDIEYWLLLPIILMSDTENHFSCHVYEILSTQRKRDLFPEDLNFYISSYCLLYCCSSTARVTYMYIRMELCQSTLSVWLSNHRTHRPLDRCVAIFKSVVTAIDYLHEANYMHRDIKVFCRSNILLTSESLTEKFEHK